jgi:hypothetical protein
MVEQIANEERYIRWAHGIAAEMLEPQTRRDSSTTQQCIRGILALELPNKQI